MEALNVLENKILTLLSFIKKLKVENDSLKKECEQLKIECTELTSNQVKINEENTSLHKNVEQLTKKLETIEESMLLNNKGMDLLNQEKVETKLLIDDLIKDIDSLVESENQQ
ncbi:hypothetical protein KAH94_02655 [bacterium]|nr:hypothetical protein [bacterium]